VVLGCLRYVEGQPVGDEPRDPLDAVEVADVEVVTGDGQVEGPLHPHHDLHREQRADMARPAMLITVFGLGVGYGTAAGSSHGQDSRPVTAVAQANTVVIRNFAYGPSSLAVSPGALVVSQERRLRW
jgi:hypothetical protein